METYPRAAQGWKRFRLFLYASLQICLSMNLLLTDPLSNWTICLFRELRLMAGRGFKQTKKQKEQLFFPPTALIKPWTRIYLCRGGQDGSRVLSGLIRSAGTGGRSEHVNEDKHTEGSWLVTVPLALEDHAWPFTVQSLGFLTGWISKRATLPSLRVPDALGGAAHSHRVRIRAPAQRTAAPMKH